MDVKIIVDPLICEGLFERTVIRMKDGTSKAGCTIGRMKRTDDILVITIPSEIWREAFENARLEEVPEKFDEQAVVLIPYEDCTYDLIFYDVDKLRKDE